MNRTDEIGRPMRPGALVRIAAWHVILLAAATPGAAEEIVVHLGPASTTVLEAAAQGRVEAIIWHGERKPVVAPVHRDGLGQPQWHIHHPWQYGHQLVLTGRGAVSLPVVLGVESQPAAGGAIELTVVPAARVSGRLRVENMGLPDWGQVVLRPCRDPLSSPRTVSSSPSRYAFAVSEAGLFDVELPLGCWELHVLAQGFAAKLGRTELEVAGSEHLLGEVAMYPAGRVVLESGVWDRQDAESVVRLIPRQAWDMACGFGEVLDAALDADYVDARESWVFEGLPPGRYLPVVQAGGESRPIGEALSVESGGSVYLRFAPEDFASLRISIEDAEEFELGSEWSFRLTSWRRVEDVDLLSCALSETIPSPSSVVTFEGLTPGTYAVELEAVFRKVLTNRVARFLVDIAPGGGSTVTVRLGGHLARGRVSHRGRPVSATVYLMERVGTGFVPFATVETAADGRFTCFLPEPGEVETLVITSHLGISSQLVTFPLDGKEVSVELPSGKIEGVVVDPEGREVAGADVRTIAVVLPDDEIDGREEWPRRAFASDWGTTTDEYGRFSLEALDAGRWAVMATMARGELASLPTVVPLLRNEERGGVRLELHPGTRIAGRVVSESGQPLANVDVGGIFQPGTAAAYGVVAERTDAGGNFEFWLWPGFNSFVDLFVVDGSIPLTSKRASSVTDVVVQVPNSGGFVRFRKAARPSGTDPLAHQLAFIGSDGAILWPQTMRLKESRRDDGEVGMTFGPLAPGRYRVYWMRPGRGTIEALWAGGGGLPLVEVVTITAGTVTEATSRVR